MNDSLISVIVSFCSAILILLRANQANIDWYSKDDKFLPRKWIKIRKPFHLKKTVKRVRFRAYWTGKLAQIIIIIYILIIIIGWLTTHSFDFITDWIIVDYYGGVSILVFLILDISLSIYVWIKELCAKID